MVWLSESIGIDSLAGARPCRNRCRVTCVSELSKQSKRERRREAPERFKINASVAVKWLQWWRVMGCVRRNRGAIAARFGMSKQKYAN